MLPEELCDYSYSLARSIADKDFGQIMHLHKEDFLVAQSSERINELKSLHEKVMFYRHLKHVATHYTSFMKHPDITSYLDWLYGSQMVGLLTNLFSLEGSDFPKTLCIKLYPKITVIRPWHIPDK